MQPWWTIIKKYVFYIFQHSTDASQLASLLRTVVYAICYAWLFHELVSWTNHTGTTRARTNMETHLARVKTWHAVIPLPRWRETVQHGNQPFHNLNHPAQRMCETPTEFKYFQCVDKAARYFRVCSDGSRFCGVETSPGKVFLLSLSLTLMQRKEMIIAQIL